MTSFGSTSVLPIAFDIGGTPLRTIAPDLDAYDEAMRIRSDVKEWTEDGSVDSAQRWIDTAARLILPEDRPEFAAACRRSMTSDDLIGFVAWLIAAVQGKDPTTLPDKEEAPSPAV